MDLQFSRLNKNATVTMSIKSMWQSMQMKACIYQCINSNLTISITSRIITPGSICCTTYYRWSRKIKPWLTGNFHYCSIGGQCNICYTIHWSWISTIWKKNNIVCTCLHFQTLLNILPWKHQTHNQTIWKLNSCYYTNITWIWYYHNLPNVVRWYSGRKYDLTIWSILTSKHLLIGGYTFQC